MTSTASGLDSGMPIKKSTGEVARQASSEVRPLTRLWCIAAVPARTALALQNGLCQRAALIGALVAERGGWRAAGRAAAAIIKREGIQGLRLRLKTAQSDVRIRHGSPADADYVNVLAATRADVLLSDWHIDLVAGLRAANLSAAITTPTLGLSLATRNSAASLPRFLEALLTQSFPLSHLNIAVVDCGSTDETRNMLETHLQNHGHRYASFTVENLAVPELTQGHDQAIRQLSDPFILVADAALELPPDTMKHALYAALADEEDVATWELRQYPDENPKYYDPVTLEAPWSSHACILVRRAAYLRVGGYERRLQGQGQDVEFSYRLRGAGWKLRYLPQVPVTHHIGPTNPGRKALDHALSASVNILLRHRFAPEQVVTEGEMLLLQARHAESVPHYRPAWAKAQDLVERHRAHFRETMRPERQVPFPFMGFGYVMSRQGGSIRLHADTLRKRPRVTVITRTHGPRVAILREAIASVINQTYSNIEHLVIEDRTDFASTLVRKVGRAYGANIRYLKSDGPGRSAAGNLGLTNASGELVMFLDNDDLIFPDHVELLVRSLDAHPRLVGAYALAWEVHTRVDDHGRYREVMHVLPGTQCQDFDRKRLDKTNFIPIQSMLFRRNLFERAGGFRVSVRPDRYAFHCQGSRSSTFVIL